MRNYDWTQAHTNAMEAPTSCPTCDSARYWVINGTAVDAVCVTCRPAKERDQVMDEFICLECGKQKPLLGSVIGKGAPEEWRICHECRSVIYAIDPVCVDDPEDIEVY